MFSNELDTVKRLSREEFLLANEPRTRIIGGTPPLNTNYSFTRTALVTGGVASLFTVQHILQSNTIWAEKAEFKFVEDGAYTLYVDKAGHFVSSYLSCYFLGEALLAADFSYDDAMIIGGFLGLSYISYIEVMDGFGANFGFSPSDFYFNASGALFYLGQYYFPYLQNIKPKFSYIPANWHGEIPREEAFFFVDDYSSQTFWLSFNIYNMVPSVRSFWPDWLELSVGYAARNLCDPLAGDCDLSKSKPFNWGKWSPYGSPRVIFALDYNLKRMFPNSKYEIVNWFIQSFDYFKWPSPAVEFEINGNPRFYLVYPF